MIKKPQFLKLIRQGDFKELFVSELGWNRYRGHSQLPSILVDGIEYNISAIAERNGFQILYTEVDEIPTQSVAKKIDTKLRRQALDYICIYRMRDTGHDLWVVPVRTNEKRDLVLVEYANANAEVIYQKIDGFSFDFDEETNIVDLRNKVQSAFAVNSEKITKDFYAGFKKQHKAFAEFIKGIDDHIETPKNKNKQWYASVMLNRLMFCYFIQKKEFFNFDKDYLRNKLNWVRQEQGENRFFSSFYRGFLSNLFHDGLNAPKHSREFINKYGKIPYLNGGMFDEHQLEKEYSDIDIPDEAFISLFDFFDKWNWHLDTRLTASGRDINPDVLGYIFEQYINDRAQMGAYYTKEDITEYIGRNCILPFLFDKVRTATKESYKYFDPDGFVWQNLRDSGKRYIFEAVKKGYDEFGKIPDSISRGLISDKMRKEYSETPIGDLPETHVPLAELRTEWNTRTPEPWGLPNEIWRETIERLQRCGEILGKINDGKITSINDFITYNLDIRTFAADLLAKADNRFVGWFYHALQSVSILDPTCGSGAFLFAAMNILEPLYEICIERMQEFNQQTSMLFKNELAEITDKYRSNIQYFIFKSIILRNLYGVDIMVEATEIAKLRLFLKMVAVVDVDRKAENLGLDPLPDIDFNIRCGNTLVGYANKEQLDKDLNHPHGSILISEANKMLKGCIDEEMRIIASSYKLFKEVQLRQKDEMQAFKDAKHLLNSRLKELNNKLNQRLYLGSHYQAVNEGEDFTKTRHYKEWLASHQPFNWLAEYYQIIEGNKGFDVIIGNPPYVGYTRKNKETGKAVIETYRIANYYKTLPATNLYAFTIERTKDLLNVNGKEGMIIPISAFANDSMSTLQKFIKEEFGNKWISTFHQRPAQLFEGVLQRLCILITDCAKSDSIFTSGIYRWYSHTRPQLFQNVSYSEGNQTKQQHVVKVGSPVELSIFDKYSVHRSTSDYIAVNRNKNNVFYRTAGGGYWVTFLNNEFDCDAVSNKQTSIQETYNAKVLTATYNSNLFWWYYTINYDLFNFKDYMIFGFQFDYSEILEDEIVSLSNILETNLRNNALFYDINSKTKGINRTVTYQKSNSKSIMDEIDTVLARHYGFTDEELDFIINYDIKYRMGEDLNN
ncbi:MAG: Eco57I restriction-modification methylase domain-containing protein [Muribaculaceae bacterium]|nr:Eco57I restriction-modification methylase domain-containing protein [Muribaculaceae bacterium]